MDISHMDATELAERIRKGELEPADAVGAAIDACRRLNPTLNAVFSERFERALEEARACKPGSAPLAGVPTLVKDLGTPEAGEPMYMGNRVLRDMGLVAPVDAHVVTKMKAAGLISIGRTTVPEFACGNCPWACENEAFGDTHNPWNPAHTVTGSSGGSAAAVAAGIVPIAHANDGGGSTRVPASANGIVGLKSSRGRISWGPIVGESWEGAATQGLVSRTVRDTALGLDLVAGHVAGDKYGCPSPARAFAHEVGANPGRLRIGVCKVNDLGPIDPDCVSAVEAVAATLADLGHQVEESHPASFFEERLFEGYFSVVAVGVAATIRALEKTIGRSFKEEDMERGTWITYQAGAPVSALEYAEGVAQMNVFTRTFVQWWEGEGGFDLLLSPVMATPPPRLGFLTSEPDDRLVRTHDTFPFTMPFSITGQPAISLPLAMSRDGLPIGIQLGARFADEATLIRVAAQLEEAMPWRDRRPGIHGALVHES